MFSFFLALFKPFPSPQLVNTGTIQMEKRAKLHFVSLGRKSALLFTKGSWGQFSNLHGWYGSTDLDSPSSENKSSLPVA